MKKFLSWKILVIVLFSLFLGFYNLPGETQKKIIPFLPDSIVNNQIDLGLDLQGGSQLEYKVSMDKVPDGQEDQVIDGVIEILNRRVNNLGVSEPNIYSSDVADEKHIIVEIAEAGEITETDVRRYLGSDKTIDSITQDERKKIFLEKAKASIGKTIQLEFKERKSAEEMEVSEEEIAEIKTEAEETLQRILENPEDFQIVADEKVIDNPSKITFYDPNEIAQETSEETTEDSEAEEAKDRSFVFESSLSSNLEEPLKNLEAGEVYPELLEISGSFTVDESGQIVEDTGFQILKLLEKQEVVKNKTEIDVRHILIAYEGAQSADASITRTEEEAKEIAEDLYAQLEEGQETVEAPETTEEDATAPNDLFTKLAQENSDDASNKENGGLLTSPVTGEGIYAFSFEEAALKLEPGEFSEPVKTQFGYHLIIADDKRTDVKENQYKYQTLSFSTAPDPWKSTGLTGEQFESANATFDQVGNPIVQINFNNEGRELFAELTERNIGQQIAIFVGGELVSAPNVNEKIVSNNAQISGSFTPDETQELARDLNTGAIPAPIVQVGEYTIGATLGAEALNESLWAGSIGIALVIIFMILYYRLPGVIASLALGVYGLILVFVIKSEISLGISLIASLALFCTLTWKIVNNKDSGWEKLLSFLIACGGLFFVTKLLQTGVVMTLAGIAGIVLSIGMAVDANILIFERIKEELKEGKKYSEALETGFERAWSAIRDSNFSTLITCLILYLFGSEMIRGFAFNLGAGVIISMLTAITITRTLMTLFVDRKISENLSLFGVKTKKSKTFKFIEKSRTWVGISGGLVVAAIIAIATFGLNLGIDFKGGSLMEFEFTEELPSKDALEIAFQETETELLTEEVAESEEVPSEEVSSEEMTESEESAEENGSEIEPIETTETTEITPGETSEENIIDFSNLQVLSAGENAYIIKTNYLSAENHDLVLAKLTEKLPDFNENRFTTIGPVIGKALLGKAITAIVFAIIFIIVFVALAFRKVPKRVSPVRFGLSAIVALVHDVVIVTGIFAVLGYFFGAEIDAFFITALLTVFGYSVNDTIVVLDRLRENLIESSSKEKLENLANKSLSETFARSVNTSFSTLLTLVAILIFGSSSIFYFVLALTIGAFVGTYSSIFLATPMLVFWSKNKKD